MEPPTSRWLACMVLFVCAPSLFAQGRLERVRSIMRDFPISPKTTSSAPNGPTRQTDNSNWSGGDPSAAIIAAGALALSPFWVPLVLLDDNLLRPGYFPGHPYAVENIRFIDPGDRSTQREMDWFDPARYKPWSLRVGLEDGNDFNGLNRVGGRFALDTAWRVGVVTNWDYFHERLPCGCTDDAVMGEFNLVYRFAQADWIQMYSGLGGRILTDRFDTFGGFNFVYGADLFLADPLVLSTQFDVGTLHEAFVVRGRATIGWQLGRLELFGGYDFLRIGSVNFQGPMLGGRLWF